jgi:hypothetical protein
VRDFLLRGHYSDTRSLGPDDLAAMRPAAPPRPRKPRAARVVPAPAVTPASDVVFGGIACFCGERFGPDRAAEFMLHLRAEVGGDLAELARIREWRRKVAGNPGYRARQAARVRERRAADPEFRERLNAAQRERRQRPDVAEQRREYQRAPAQKAQRNARQAERRREQARPCQCGCGEMTSQPGVRYKAGHHNRVKPTRVTDPAKVAEAVQRRNAGDAVQLIATAMGVHPETVRRWLRSPNGHAQ